MSLSREVTKRQQQQQRGMLSVVAPQFLLLGASPLALQVEGVYLQWWRRGAVGVKEWELALLQLGMGVQTEEGMSE